jgi:GTP cyclohydrolase IA
MYAELLAGMNHDPSEHLESIFHEKYDEIVLLQVTFPFTACASITLMPFIGKAHVAYLPDGKGAWQSASWRGWWTRFARRLQLQERLTDQIADFLMQKLSPQGVSVVLEASHSCMTIRGVRKPGAMMVTSALARHFQKATRGAVRKC